MPNTVKGVEQLHTLAHNLEAQGNDRKLKNAISKQLREVVKPVGEAAKEHAREILPHHGGLNEWVAGSRMSIRSQQTGKYAGVRLTASRRSAAGFDVWLQAIDGGNLRHPVFARSDQTRRDWKWHDQHVPPGWFTKPAEDALPKIQDSLLKVLDDINARLRVK